MTLEDLEARVKQEIANDTAGDEWGRGAWHDLANDLFKALKDEREKRVECIVELAIATAKPGTNLDREYRELLLAKARLVIEKEDEG